MWSQKKIVYLLLACLCMLVLLAPSTGFSQNDGYVTLSSEQLTFRIQDGEAFITGVQLNDTLDRIALPDELDGCPVAGIDPAVFFGQASLQAILLPPCLTSIGEYAFTYCGNLSDVVLPDGLTHLGNSAFDGCGSLERIILPVGLTALGEYAFASCWRLAEVTLPEGLLTIGQRAFERCAVSQLILPASLTGIGAEAFAGCYHLQSVSFPEGESGSLAEICDSAFSFCQELTEFPFPDTLTSIGREAFAYCDNFTDILIPASLTQLGASAFSGRVSKTGLSIHPDNPIFSFSDGLLMNNVTGTLILYAAEQQGVYTVPDGVTVIGDNAYAGCGMFTKIIIPGSVKHIGKDAFDACTGLEGDVGIVLSDGLESIGDGAFSQCWWSSTIEIPQSVTSIGVNPFLRSSLTSITVHPDNPIYTHLDGVLIDTRQGLLVSYPVSKPDPRYSVPSGVKIIGPNAFYEIHELTEVSLPEGLTEIGDMAFANCYKLASVSLPESLVSINYYAFGWCDELKELTIPAGVTDIGFSAIDTSVFLRVAEGSYAQGYAEENGYAFEVY
jgi:hypothetical protein